MAPEDSEHHISYLQKDKLGLYLNESTLASSSFWPFSYDQVTDGKLEATPTGELHQP
jgi:hypothetical protein